MLHAFFITMAVFPIHGWIAKMNLNKSLFSTLVAFLCVSGGAIAEGSHPEGALEEGTYFLNNHPDGGVAPVFYGLRLDELIDVTSDHDIFTFDFEHQEANMQITVDSTSIRIFGTAFGGIRNGSGYGDSSVGLWDIDFTYSSFDFASGDDDREVTGLAPDDHFGTIVSQFDGTSFWLQDHSNGNFSFRLGDKDNDNGHRGFDGVSGWGWLNHAPLQGSSDGLVDGPTEVFPHANASDWLFTVGDRVIVPEPASAVLFMIGSMAMLRRRR